MGVDSMEFQQRIYDLVNGYWNLSDYPVAESEFVKNEFAQGSFCNRAYGKVLDAYASLCDRLHPGCEEDPDVEIMIDEMNGIMKHIALTMFQYGVFFARREM